MSAASRRARIRGIAGTSAVALAMLPSAAVATDFPLEPRESANSVAQSVQIRATADGTPNGSAVDFRWSVTQITAQGDPNTQITVRVPEEGALLHSLQQFGTIPQEDGQGVFDIDLNDQGFGTARSVSLFPQDMDLPVEIRAEFTLDGEPISSTDLVGKSGLVTATYTVSNMTGQEVEVPITSVTGDEVEKTVTSTVPMVVEAGTLLPQAWAGLNTGTGLGGADGRGNWQIKWIALPFAPLSPDGTAQFGWAAHVTDAVIPAMLVQVLPVYIPEGGAEEEGASAEDITAAGEKLGVAPPDVSGEVASIRAGVEDVISGLETLTADDGGEDPLDIAEGRINAFFEEFAGNFEAIAAATDPDNPESITSAIREFSASLGELEAAVAELRDALDAYDQSQIPEAIETLDANFEEFIAAVEGALALLDGIVPGKDNPAAACPIIAAIPDVGVTEQQCRDLVALLELVVTDIPATEAAINDLNNVLNQVDGAVAVLQPLLAQVAGLLEKVVTGLTALDPKLVALNEQLTIIANGLAEKNVDLPSLDALLADITESILNSEGGQQVTSGLDQIGGGIAGVKSEIGTYAAELVVALQAAKAEVAGAVESGKEAAGAVVERADMLKAEVAGLVMAAHQSPLPYGGDPAEAPEGTKLAGAYEFRLDPADHEAPSTLPRILISIVLLVGAGLLGSWAAGRRQAVTVTAGAGAGAATPAAPAGGQPDAGAPTGGPGPGDTDTQDVVSDPAPAADESAEAGPDPEAGSDGNADGTEQPAT